MTARQLSREQYSTLAAWLVVLQRVGIGDIRLLTILAIGDFAGHACIRCDPCATAGLLITEVPNHLRLTSTSRHALRLDDDALEVTP